MTPESVPVQTFAKSQSHSFKIPLQVIAKSQSHISFPFSKPPKRNLKTIPASILPLQAPYYLLCIILIDQWTFSTPPPWPKAISIPPPKRCQLTKENVFIHGDIFISPPKCNEKNNVHLKFIIAPSMINHEWSLVFLIGCHLWGLGLNWLGITRKMYKSYPWQTSFLQKFLHYFIVDITILT